MAQKKSFDSTTSLFLTDSEEKKKQPQRKRSPKSVNVPDGYKLVKEPKNQRIQVLMREKTREQLKEIATSQGTSVNDVINTILEEYFERSKK